MTGRMPAHVACIMDGNGRWALRRHLARIEGHAAGEAAILRTVEAAQDLGVRWLTLFAFSTENWNRPIHEVRFLMRFNRNVIRKHGASFHARNIRVRYMGEHDQRIPPALRREMDAVQRLTERNSGLTFTMAFNYGGRAELVGTLRRILETGVDPHQINEGLMARHLPFPDMPDVDLLIRTSGEFRLSNFMLWRCAYSELVFTDVYWPDFQKSHLHNAISTYQQRHRRFGTIPDAEPAQRTASTNSGSFSDRRVAASAPAG